MDPYNSQNNFYTQQNAPQYTQPNAQYTQPYAQPYTQQYAQPQYTQPDMAPRRSGAPQYREKNRNGLLIAGIIAAAVVLVALIAFLVIFLLGHRNNGQVHVEDNTDYSTEETVNEDAEAPADDSAAAEEAEAPAEEPADDSAAAAEETAAEPAAETGCYVLTEKARDTGYTCTYTYDEQGHMLSWSNGSATETYTADENGRVTSSDYEGDMDLFVGTYVYDSEGRLTEKDVEGNTTAYFGAVYEYDEQGRLSDCLMETDHYYQYDETGRVIRCISMIYAGCVEVEEYEYDENGNLSGSRIYNQVSVDYDTPLGSLDIDMTGSTPDQIVTWTWEYLPNASADTANYMTMYLTD